MASKTNETPDIKTRLALHAKYQIETPELGTPVTLSIGSDDYAYRVVGILAKNKIEIRSEEGGSTRTSIAIRTARGWRLVGRPPVLVYLGYAVNYCDPAF